MDFRDNLQKYHEFIAALEQERRKILVFRRELPLCLELVTQALEACKRRLGTAEEAECLNPGGQSDQSSEQTATTTCDRRPVLAEFLPVKRTSSSSASYNTDDEGAHGEEELQSHLGCQASDDSCIKKSDWLRSVQLWNQTAPSPPTTITSNKEAVNQPRKVSVVEVKGNGGAFRPFQKGTVASKDAATEAVPSAAPEATSASSTVERTGAAAAGGAAKKGEEEALSSQRKRRRCWSPELHKRFLNALQEIGGSHVATPKQIRERMKVDGLTNDEVKSHLQKYRLHTRRPAAPASNTNAQAPRIVVVGGIWVPPPSEYSAVAAVGATAVRDPSAATAPPGIYAPLEPVGYGNATN